MSFEHKDRACISLKKLMVIANKSTLKKGCLPLENTLPLLKYTQKIAPFKMSKNGYYKNFDTLKSAIFDALNVRGDGKSAK